MRPRPTGDAYVLADTARTRRHQVHWLDTESDALLAKLRVLNGFDIDLAADQNRLPNRLRDALTRASPRRWNGPWATASTRPACATCLPSTRP
ncbi:MAG: IS110 family transposase [Frankiaceae bacterium]